MQVQSLDKEDLLEEGMATHSSILAWKIPWTEEPDGLLSLGSQSQTRLKRLSMHACIGEGNGSPLQYSCLENPHEQRSLAAYSPWSLKEFKTTE